MNVADVSITLSCWLKLFKLK